MIVYYSQKTQATEVGGIGREAKETMYYRLPKLRPKKIGPKLFSGSEMISNTFKHKTPGLAGGAPGIPAHAPVCHTPASRHGANDYYYKYTTKYTTKYNNNVIIYTSYLVREGGGEEGNDIHNEFINIFK